MAFIKRDNGNETMVSASNNRQNKSTEKALDSNKIINSMKAKNDEAKQKAYYLERSKVILTHLENTRGFDFYDPNRQGGMHLRNAELSTKNDDIFGNNFKDESVNSEVVKALLAKAKQNNDNNKNKRNNGK